MSRSDVLYELWNNENEDGVFWMVHTISVLSKNEIECMHFKQLKSLVKKMNEYEESIKQYNQIAHDLVNGYKIVKKCLDEREIMYYNNILYTKYSTSSKTANDIQVCYIVEDKARKTYKDIYDEAAKKIRKDYQKKNKANYLELKKITDEINLKELLKQRKKELDALDEAPASERNKYYELKRLINDPEKEQKRKELGLLRLKEWKETDPKGYAESQAKYRAKKQDLTTCQTDEELAAKMVRNAINKALKKLDNAERYKLKKLI